MLTKEEIVALPPANYKTFAELAEYARQRAKISAARRGHQEFAYWLLVEQWATDCVDEASTPQRELTHYLGIVQSNEHDAMMKAEAYAFCVHCRKMLINQGENPPRLSLKWLREAAAQL